MQIINTIFFDHTGRLRSGWRASMFVVAWVFIAVLIALIKDGIFAAFGFTGKLDTGTSFLMNGLLSLIPAILAGWLCGKLLEKLPYRALGAAFTAGWLKHFALGNVIGALTIGFAVLIAVAGGGLQFEINPLADTAGLARSLAISFVIFAAASAFEEALCRGYVLQTFSRSGLAWLAIAITSVIFGAGHMGNPNAGVISTANTVLAGIWFSVAYLKTRDLWFAWGLHLMWNFAQGALFGIEVSGLTEIVPVSFLREIDSGPAWLTGETYGIEGGIVCTIALVASTAAIWFLPILKADEELVAMTSPTRSGS